MSPFALFASISVSLLAASSAPTPLYRLYQAQWGFTSTTITVIFAVYALAVLAALLVAGRLSDHVGRRPVILGALAVQVGAMLLFATAHGVNDLIVARVIQGLSTGAALGAVAGGLLDLSKAHGATANTVAAPLGTASGAMMAGLMVQYLPEPTHLVYAVLAIVLALQAVGVFMMEETHPSRPGAWASLKPQIRVSAAARRPMLLAIPALVATWALAGFYASLGPSLVRGMFGFDSSVLGGLSLFVMAGSAAIVTLLMRDSAPERLTRIGGFALLGGVAAAIVSMSVHSAVLFFAATALAGAGFGAGFQGAIRAVASKAAAHERAGTLSVAFIVSYLAMGVPAIIAGYFATRQGDIVTTAREFGVAVMALAIVTLIGTRVAREACVKTAR